MNLPYSVSCYLNVKLIQNTLLDCLTAFQVIILSKKETLIMSKFFLNNYGIMSMLKYIVHFVSIKNL